MLIPSILAETTSRADVSKELVGVAVALGMATVFAAVPIVGPGMAIVGGTSAWLVKALKREKISVGTHEFIPEKDPFYRSMIAMVMKQ